MVVCGSVIKKAEVQGKEHMNSRGQPVEARHYAYVGSIVLMVLSS
jgi:hypothetical protein